jgi:hypothetical protein
MLGLGNSITAGGATSEEVFDGYSILLDGTDDFLENTDFDATLIQDAYTISAWVKVAAGNATCGIIGLYDNDGDDTYFLRTSNGVIRSQQKNVSAAQQHVAPSGDIRGSWTHIVATWTKEDRMHVYTNGGASAGGATTTHSSDGDENLQDGDNGIRIGSQNRDNLSNPFGGLINDIAIWSTELDATAIEALYNLGKPMDVTDSYSSNLVAYWKMEEGSGTTVADSSSNSYTLTFSAAPEWSTDIP